MLSEAGLYMRTVRHLRATQIMARLRLKLPKTPTPQGNLNFEILQPPPGWTAPVLKPISFPQRGIFSFLNASAAFADIGWVGDEMPPLWRYNQHYFDDLCAQDAQARQDIHQDLITQWIDQNPMGSAVAWDPYPTSLRIVNWVKYGFTQTTMPAHFYESLALQARHLNRNIEWHILGNHLFANGKALLFAGLWFAGPEAEAWRKTAFAILTQEVKEQFLEDGGHFERSPMYHAILLEDLLDLVNLLRCYHKTLTPDLSALLSALTARLPSALIYLQNMTHGDGEVSFFNDAAMGIAALYKDLAEYAQRLGFSPSPAQNGGFFMGPSGYAGMRGSDGACLLVDIAAVGPDYLPGHAHADSLSFELSFGATRVITNGGTSEYGTSPERHRQRGTAAHATLMCNHQNSSEVWGGFRVGRRAKIHDINVQYGGGGFCAKASHSGYAHLSGRPIHHRGWTYEPGRLVISDTLSGRGTYPVSIQFPLHPEISCQKSNTGILLTLPEGQTPKHIHVTLTGADVTEIENTSWHPQFGISLPSVTICARRSGPLPQKFETVFEWDDK